MASIARHASSSTCSDKFDQPTRHRGAEAIARAPATRERRSDASAGASDFDRARIAARAGRGRAFSAAAASVASSCARSSLRRILPSGFFGSASMNSIDSGRLKLARRVRQNSAMLGRR